MASSTSPPTGSGRSSSSRPASSWPSPPPRSAPPSGSCTGAPRGPPDPTRTSRKGRIMNSTSDSYVLCARGLRKDHGRDASLVRAVDGVDLGVAAGETVAIMGPSGCGKSTLLYLLGGLDRPTSGEIWLAGQNLTPMSERGLARLRRERI